MREIKFRFWDKQFKHFETFAEPAIFNGGIYELISCSKDSVSFSIDKTDRYEVMQYTGLKDKNGKEIYEGDIIRLGKNQKHYEVAWSEIIAGFIIKNGGPNYELADYEVIGNIYETPELLEAK